MRYIEVTIKVVENCIGTDHETITLEIPEDMDDCELGAVLERLVALNNTGLEGDEGFS